MYDATTVSASALDQYWLSFGMTKQLDMAQF